MATFSLPEAASSLLLEPPKFRPLPLRWNHLLRTHRYQLPLKSQRSIHLALRATLPPIAPSSSHETDERDSSHSTFDRIAKAVLKTLNSLKKPVAAAILLGVLIAGDPYAALAASGGRMGGSAFTSSSRSQSSHSSPPPPYSSSWSYSDPSPSYSSPSRYSAPFYSSSPFVSVGPVVGFSAGSNFLLIMMGFLAFLILTGFLSDFSNRGSVLTETQKTSVVKLQVGLLGLARSFQKDLDEIAEKADTSTPSGLSFVLTETTLALLRHPDCCISAYSSVDVKRTPEDGERRFNQLSIEERGKFDEETLVNFNNVKRIKSGGRNPSSFSNEYIVITLLVAAEGVYKLPAINSSLELKKALQKLASIPSSKILAVEVLWTPQNETDTLSERQLLEDYPLLRPL